MCPANVRTAYDETSHCTRSAPPIGCATAVGLGIWWTLSACGQASAPKADGPIVPESPTTAASVDAGTNAQRPTVFSLSVDGIAVDGGAGAAIVIREDDGAWLEVSSGLSSDGFLTMRLQLSNQLSVVGAHELPLQGPQAPNAIAPLRPTDSADPEATASASIEGREYFAQGGQASVEVFADQSLDGRFAIEFAPLSEPQPGQMPQFEPTEDFLLLEGNFSGPWNLSCYSRIIAHPTWVPGGAFCEALQL